MSMFHKCRCHINTLEKSSLFDKWQTLMSLSIDLVLVEYVSSTNSTFPSINTALTPISHPDAILSPITFPQNGKRVIVSFAWLSTQITNFFYLNTWILFVVSIKSLKFRWLHSKLAENVERLNGTEHII